MKKKILFLFMLIFISLSFSAAGEAEQEWEWAYEVREDDTAMVTGYTGSGGEVTIPDSLDGYLVTSLAADVFRFNEEITSVNIPAGLISFGDYKILPENKRLLFGYNDTGKPFILEPEAAKIFVDYFAEYAGEDQINPFLGCCNLGTISVSPENPVFAVVDNMLINKVTNETVSYPAGRQETDYTIPEGITSIGFQTFFGSILTSVSLPESLAEIRQNPFIFCVNLSEISVSDKNPVFSVRDGALVGDDGTLISYPMVSDRASYTVPEGVTIIGDGAFFNNMALEEVNLPESVTIICGRAFDHCENLKTVVLQEGLISIKDGAFKNCEDLTEIYLPATLTYIDEMAFYNVGKGLLFTVEKNTYGALWTQVQQYRYHFPGEPEQKSLLTQTYDKLKNEDGKITNIHLKYRAEHMATGYTFTRDAYIMPDVTYVIDEDEENGVTVTMYKDHLLYTLYPESKTGTVVERDHWLLEEFGVTNETRRLLSLIGSYVNRTDYISVGRMLNNHPYRAEVYPEYRFGPEIAFYFDVNYEKQDVQFVYVYEEKYHGFDPVRYPTGELLFTILEFSNEVAESVFDISDYEITVQSK